MSHLAGAPTIQAEIVRAGAGLVQFLVLARVLGAAGFGQLAVLTVAAGLLQPLLVPQVGLVLVRAAAAGQAQRHLLRGLVRACLRAGVLVGPLAILGVAAGVLGASVHTVWLLWWSELCALGVLAGLGAIAQGQRRFARYRDLVMLSAVARTGAALSLLLVPGADLETWATVLALATTPPAVVVAVLSFWRAPAAGPVPPRSRDVWVFSLNALTVRLSDDADKALVAAYAGYAAVGAYTAAYRLASYVLVPVRGVLAEFAPRLFGSASGSGKLVPWDQVRAARRRLLLAVAVAAPALYGGALLAPHVLGAGYGAVPGFAFVLVPALGLRGVHYLFGDLLTAVGRVRRRLVAQALSLSVPVGTCLLLVPVFGAWGAVAATALGEVLAVALMGFWARKVVDADRRYGGEGHESVRRYSHAR